MSAKAILWTILLIVVGLGTGWLAIRDAIELRRTAQIWEEGKTALDPRAELSPTSLAGIAWEFDGKLTYASTTGEPHRSVTHFFRMGSANEFTAPGVQLVRGGSEPIEIRYLASAPNQATVNWAYLGLREGWIRVALCVVVALVSLSMVIRVLRGETVTVPVT